MGMESHCRQKCEGAQKINLTINGSEVTNMKDIGYYWDADITIEKNVMKTQEVDLDNMWE